MKIKTTARCGRTPTVLLALEELGISYSIEVMPDGSFIEREARMGPTLEDGELRLFEHNAMVRHLARLNPTSPLAPANEAEACAMDQWMDFSVSHLRPQLARVGEAMAANAGQPPPPELIVPLRRALGVLDAAVTGKEFLLGRFTLCDCAFAGLDRISQLGQITTGLPSLPAWIGRIAARPAWERIKARQAT